MVTYSQLEDSGAEVPIQPHRSSWEAVRAEDWVQLCLCLYREDHFPGMEALDQMIAGT